MGVVGPFVMYWLIDSVSATAINCVPVTVILLVTLNVSATRATRPSVLGDTTPRPASQPTRVTLAESGAH